MKIMRWLALILLTGLILTGCSSKIEYDSQYGVGYYLNDSGITIHLDCNKSDRIANIWIAVAKSETKLDVVNADWNTDISKADEYPITYYVSQNDDGTYFERAVLNFYRKDFNVKESQSLLEYLGILEMLGDGQLLYEDELLKSDSFRFKSIIQTGQYVGNISFSGDPKYNY